MSYRESQCTPYIEDAYMREPEDVVEHEPDGDADWDYQKELKAERDTEQWEAKHGRT